MSVRLSSWWRGQLDVAGAFGRPPGWRPGRRQVVWTIALAIFVGAGMSSEALRERGPLAALLVAGLITVFAVSVLKPGGRAPLAQAHPYVDAAFSIPIGLTAALLLTRWSTAACLAASGLYAAVVFALTARRLARTADCLRTGGCS